MTKTHGGLPSELEIQIRDDLLDRFGPLLHGRALLQALGYASNAALQQSIVRKTVPVPLFNLEGRRGRYALTWVVARWLAAQASPKTSPPHLFVVVAEP